MPNKTDVVDLTKAVRKYLEEYQEDIEDDVVETVDKVTQEAKEDLIQSSHDKFKTHGRKKPYYSGWAVKLSKKQPGRYNKVIWNRTNYQLTHLLEFRSRNQERRKNRSSTSHKTDRRRIQKEICRRNREEDKEDNMTLEELKTRCNTAGIQYAYGLFKTPTEPPHLVAYARSTENFMADNKVYNKDVPIQMDYTYIDKDITTQNKIEDQILGDIPWEKTDEVYLPDEDVWQVSYIFNL